MRPKTLRQLQTNLDLIVAGINSRKDHKINLELLSLEKVAKALDEIVVPLMPTHLEWMNPSLEDENFDLGLEALFGHIRTCVIAILQKGEPKDMRAGAGAIYILNEETDLFLDRLDELAKLLGTSAAIFRLSSTNENLGLIETSDPLPGSDDEEYIKTRKKFLDKALGKYA